MKLYDWLPSPTGIDAPKWVTRAGCRTALIVVHTLVSGDRLLDAVDYIESDRRVQVASAIAPDAFNHAVPEFLRGLDALVLPWAQATRERFDHALTATYGGLDKIHAPLVVLPHGARCRKHTRRLDDGGLSGGNGPVYGLSSQHLTRDGRVLASAVVLAHEDDRLVIRAEQVIEEICHGSVAFSRVRASGCTAGQTLRGGRG